MTKTDSIKSNIIDLPSPSKILKLGDGSKKSDQSSKPTSYVKIFPQPPVTTMPQINISHQSASSKGIQIITGQTTGQCQIKTNLVQPISLKRFTNTQSSKIRICERTSDICLSRRSSEVSHVENKQEDGQYETRRKEWAGDEREVNTKIRTNEHAEERESNSASRKLTDIVRMAFGPTPKVLAPKTSQESEIKVQGENKVQTKLTFSCRNLNDCIRIIPIKQNSSFNGKVGESESDCKGDSSPRVIINKMNISVSNIQKPTSNKVHLNNKAKSAFLDGLGLSGQHKIATCAEPTKPVQTVPTVIIPNAYMIQNGLQRTFDMAAFEPFHDDSVHNTQCEETKEEKEVKEKQIIPKTSESKKDKHKARDDRQPNKNIENMKKSKDALEKNKINDTDHKKVHSNKKCIENCSPKEYDTENKSKADEQEDSQTVAERLRLLRQKNQDLMTTQMFTTILQRWEEYLTKTPEEMLKYELENARQHHYSKDAMDMIEDQDLYVWQLIGEMSDSIDFDSILYEDEM